jgi:hypothetical protein
MEWRIGARDPDMDRLLRQHGARAATLIGAWNPQSQLHPPGWNRRADRRLRDHLRRYRWIHATGGTRRWWEEHVLLLGDPRPALILARRFRQRAVVVVRRGQKARLVVAVQAFVGGVQL